MKRLKQHWSARPITWLMSLYIMVMPFIILFLASATTVKAQGGVVRNALPLWAVLDFANRSGYGGNEIGRQASDAFVLELGKTMKYELIPRQEIVNAINKLGLPLPLDTIGLQRLGRDESINAGAVVSGEVATVSFSSNPRRATASLIIKVTDTSTGELVNGAIAQGTSNPRPIGSNDDDALVNQAISNAAFAAVKQISSFTITKATVLSNLNPDSILLNKGTRDGISDGLDMIVTRGDTEVGRIRVSHAGSDQSDAVETRRETGIRPGDKATAVYKLPPYVIQGQNLVADQRVVASEGNNGGQPAKRNSFSGVGGILVAILVGALLLSLVKRGSSQGSVAGAQVGSPIAKLINYDPGLPPTGFADTFRPVAVEVTATSGNIDSGLMRGFTIYRSDITGGAVITGGSGSGTGGTAFTRMPVGGTSDFYANKITFYDDGDTDLTTYQARRADLFNGGGFTGASGSTTIAFTHPGITLTEVGKKLYYSIEACWQDQNISVGSGNISNGLWHETGQVNTNSITYLQPPFITDSNLSVFGSTLSLTNVPAVPGANEYQLEVSDDQFFSRNVTKFYPTNPGTIFAGSYNPTLPRTSGLKFSFNLNMDISKYVSKGTIFARLRVRDTSNGTDENRNPPIYGETIIKNF